MTPRNRRARNRTLLRTRVVQNRRPVNIRASNRRGRAANGRFVSRDGSEMARKLREMMADAPDDSSRQEIQRLAERMEQM